ncbi:MAG TPA: hypothetical protein VFE15_15865 [Marmoricola sp.]|jgi:hypothetical protein|nr:hypothetical protein [Marmoricola sp.]
MQLNPRSLTMRAQAAVSVLAVTVGLTVAPALLVSANAASSGHAAADRSSTSAACTSAETAVTHARSQQATAKRAVAKAKKALAKAKRAKSHRAAKVRKAKKLVKKANQRYAAATRSVASHQSAARTACKTSPAPTANPATGLGQELGLLGLGDGMSLGPISANQLTSLLDQLLPGAAASLDPSQLTALLGGFNGAGDLGFGDAVTLLSGLLDPAQVLDILAGGGSPEALTDLGANILSQLSSLGGGSLPVPGDFDPTGLYETFAGMFGNLSPDQLGSLLGLLTSAFGAGSSAFDVGQLTSLLDSLVPGISDEFDPSQLTDMLGALNGGGLSASTLSNLLGGQFDPTQLLSVLGGSAGSDLLSSVITQVMAQLATAGGGGLSLPGSLDPSQVTTLISTVSSLVTGLLGSGGGVLPIVCGLVPIPLVCS